MNYKYKVSCSTERLKSVREFVENSLKGHVLSELQISQMVLAVDEICANMIIHTHGCDSSKSIDIHIHVENQSSVTFEIIDHGQSFNYQLYQEPELSEIVKNKKKGGIGLMLVKRIMDEVEFTSETGKNICRLFKRL